MYIIVGLGNPKKEYANTRHNIGFDIIDVIGKNANINVLEKKHKAIIGKGYINGQKVILAKPQTYMNLSGESVRELINYYSVLADPNVHKIQLDNRFDTYGFNKNDGILYISKLFDELPEAKPLIEEL